MRDAHGWSTAVQRLQVRFVGHQTEGTHGYGGVAGFTDLADEATQILTT